MLKQCDLLAGRTRRMIRRILARRPAAVPPPHFALETLEPRLMLSGNAPIFAQDLLDRFVSNDGALTIGIDGFDAEGDNLTITATSSNPNISLFIPQGNPYAKLNFTESDHTPIGSILVQLFEGRSESAVDRFVTLATTGYESYDAGAAVDPNADPYYTDVTVHRVIPGFVIQTGDAQYGNGTGGSPLGDFDDDFDPILAFGGDGVLAMANSGADTNDSQFFITDAPTPHLNQKHMIFGQVINGQDVFQDIINRQTNSSNRPLDPPLMSSVDIIDSPQDGTLTIRALNNFLGEADITVTLSDGTNTTSQTFTVTSLGNRVVAGSGSDTQLEPGVPEVINAPGSDDGNLPIEYTVLSVSDSIGVTVDNAAGKFNYSPPADFEGLFSVTYTAREAGFSDRLGSTGVAFGVVQSPGAPPVLGRVDLAQGGTTMATAMTDDVLVVAAGTGSVVFYEFNSQGVPTNPVIDGDLVGASVQDVDITDDGIAVVTLRTSTNAGFVLSYNINNPNGITRPDFLATQGGPSGVVVDGNFAYVAAGNAGVASYRVTAAGDITERDYAFDNPSGADILAATGVAKIGDYLFVSSTNQGIFVLDVSDPTDMQVVNLDLTVTTPAGIAVHNGMLYVTDQNNANNGANGGLYAFDVSDPTDFVLVDFLPIADRPRTVSFVDDSAIVGTNANYAFVDAFVPDDMLLEYTFQMPFISRSSGTSPTGGRAGVMGSLIALPAGDDGFLLMDGTNLGDLAGPEIQVKLDGGSEVQTVTQPIDLGTVERDFPTLTQTLTVTNAGTEDLTLSQPVLPSGFILQTPLASTTLTPGQSATFTIAVDNTSAGTKAGTVTIASNDRNEANFTFDVTAEVTATDATDGLNETFDNGLEGFATQGNVAIVDDGSTSNNVAQLTEGSDASLSRLYTLPSNVDGLAFRYRFTNLGDGDSLVVSINGTPVHQQVGTSLADTNFVTISDVDLMPYAGQDIELTFTLVSTGDANAQVQIDDVVMDIDPRVITPFTGRFNYTDAAGREVTLIFRGPGTATLIQPLAGNQDASQIILEDTTLASSLIIRTQGNAPTTVGQIDITGDLNQINAPTTNLQTGIDASGAVRRIIMADVLAGDTLITLGGDATSPRGSFSFDNISDLNFQTGMDVASFAADTWIDTNATMDLLQLPSVNLLRINGDVQFNMNLTDANQRGRVLGRAIIERATGNQTWSLNGDAGNLIFRDDINGLIVNVTGQLNTFVADQVTNADLQAQTLLNLRVTDWLDGTVQGQTLRALIARGDFMADLTLTGSTQGNALTRALVLGDVDSTQWNIEGPVLNIDLRGTIDSWQLNLNDSLRVLRLGSVSASQVNALTGGINVLIASQWIGGSIATGTLNVLRTTGDRNDANNDGDFSADLFLLGTDDLVMRNASIAGTLADGTWALAGGVLNLTANGSASTWQANVAGELRNLTMRDTASGSLAAASIRNARFNSDVVDLLVLVGADLGQDAAPGGTGNNADSFGPGSINNLLIRGAMDNARFAVGVDPVDGVLFNGNDQFTGNPGDNQIRILNIFGGASNGSFILADNLPAKVRFDGARVDADTVDILSTDPTMVP